MRRSLRAFLVAFALIGLPLGALGGAGIAVALRQLGQSRDMASAQAFGAVATLVDDAGGALRREAALLARDPALMEGVAKGDWATLARFALPRILAVSRDGFADLVAVRDSAGKSLLQVPPVPPPVLPSFPALAEPIVTVRLVDGHPFFLAAAPIRRSEVGDERSPAGLGMIVVGRRFEGIGRLLDSVPGRPAVVFLVGDRAVGATRPGVPTSGWTAALGAGRVAIGADRFALRPLAPEILDSPDGSLWALVPATQFRAVQWKLWTWLAAVFAVGAVILGLGIWAVMRDPASRDRVAGGEQEAPDLGRRTPDPREREIEAPDPGEGARRSAAEHQALFEVAGLVGSTLEIERVLDLIADRCRALIGVTSAGIFKLDAEAGVLVYERGVGLSPEFVRALRVRVGEGTTGRAARDRTPVWTADILADAAISLAPDTRDLVMREGYRAVLSVPILIKDELHGVLSSYWWEPHAPSPSEIALMSGLAAQAAVALENARLYSETAGHLEQTRALLEVAEILNSTLEPRRLLKQVAIKIAQVCRVDRCTIERWDGDRVIPLMSQFADGRKDERMWRAFMTMPSSPPRQVPAHVRAIETRRPVVIPDTAATDLIPREWTDTYAIKSYMVVPLIRQDAVIGVMNLDHVERVTPFERWQVELAMAIAAQLALTIENTRLYGEAQERLRETAALLAVAQVLSQPAPASEVMRALAREVAHAFGADMVGVYLLDERKEALVPAAGYHVPKHLLRFFGAQRFVLARFPVLSEAWRSGRAFGSPDVKNDPRFDPESFAGMDPHSVLVAPTMVRGEAVGALFLVWWGTGREFQPAEIRLLEGVAFQVGLAMENVELARQTQQKLEETERLLAVSRTLASTLDLDTLPRQFLRHVVRALRADSAGLWLLDETGEWMEPLVGYHIPPDQLEALRRLRLSIARHPFYAEAARTRRPIVSTDVMRDERVPQALRDVAPHGTQLFVPIIAKDRVLGGFAVTWSEAHRDLSESELRLMEAIASQAGVALDNARLFRDNQRRVEELSVLYEERTRAHRELAAAQDQLVRTEKLRAMGEMASGVAHDFNNVLAAVLGRAQLLLKRVEDPKLRQWVEVIERSALDGARTVRRLQDFTRIRRDHPVVPVDLNRVVQETLEGTESTWRQESRSRGIQIEVTTSLASPLPQVSGDPAELREGLTNLILNALDAMPGGGKLTLTTGAAGEQVEITVTDTGAGIPSAIRHKIFDPFFTTKGPKGTGLGLSMTYGILARHGGRITVESEEGRGTTFRLTFPAAPPTDESPRPPATSPGTAASARVLVVDDEEVVAAVLGDMLVAAGHRVDVVSSGREALARFSGERFDVVVTDLAMPGMTGWEVARAVKDVAPAVGVVLVSGFGVEVSPEDLRANGVDLVLAKPVKLEDIGAVVALARSAQDA